jgi:hypothetical protein
MMEASVSSHVTMKHAEKAESTWNNENNTVRGLDLAFTEAAEVTGTSKSKIRDHFDSYLALDGASFFVGHNTTCGRAIANIDRKKLHKLTTTHYDAIHAFIAFRNSSKGAAKVRMSRLVALFVVSGCDLFLGTLKQVTLDESRRTCVGLTQKVPILAGICLPTTWSTTRQFFQPICEWIRSSLHSPLLHHLKFVYANTEKQPTFADPKKRHQRIRKYIIERLKG